MAAKKRKKTPGRKRTAAKGKAFKTTFIKDCLKFIFTDPAIGFMDRAEPRAVTVKNFGTIASVLLGAVELGIPPGPAPADPVAAALTGFLVARPWPPVRAARAPAGFGPLRPKTLQRVEVAEILEALLQRVDKGSGGGGGGSDWPPHVRT